MIADFLHTFFCSIRTNQKNPIRIPNPRRDFAKMIMHREIGYSSVEQSDEQTVL